MMIMRSAGRISSFTDEFMKNLYKKDAYYYFTPRGGHGRLHLHDLKTPSATLPVTVIISTIDGVMIRDFILGDL